MKTVFRIFGPLMVLIGIFVLGLSFGTFDYGNRCTRCLRDYHVVEKQFMGFTYWQTQALRFEGNDLVPALGSPCVHIYRKVGFGRSIGGLWGGGIACGITAEGLLFDPRWRSLKAAFTLDEKFKEPALMRETLQLVDEILPADTTIAFFRTGGYHDALSLLATMAEQLKETATKEQWRYALAGIRREWSDKLDGAKSVPGIVRQ